MGTLQNTPWIFTSVICRQMKCNLLDIAITSSLYGRQTKLDEHETCISIDLCIPTHPRGKLDMNLQRRMIETDRVLR